MRDKVTKRKLDQLNVDASSDYANKIAGGTTGNLVSIAADGDVADSGVAATDIQNAIEGDTNGRQFRQIYLKIDDGTNANTLKCTVGNLYNGDTIAETDNVAKDATTGHFTLSVAGSQIEIEDAGLSGKVVMAHGNLAYDQSGTTNPIVTVEASGNNILVEYMTGAAGQDLTAAVDSGAPLEIYILYLTDA
jgi:hypothetical protein